MNYVNQSNKSRLEHLNQLKNRKALKKKKDTAERQKLDLRRKTILGGLLVDAFPILQTLHPPASASAEEEVFSPVKTFLKDLARDGGITGALKDYLSEAGKKQ